MTDRELIELAAKAEGRQIAWDARGAYTVVDGISGGNVWNPLHDDADAFRLAVKLEMAIIIEELASFAIVSGGKACKEPADKQGSESATRRAITRAAAEIGKAMEKSS
jgi:hypothetical protein